jgi:hypothetical protein
VGRVSRHANLQYSRTIGVFLPAFRLFLVALGHLLLPSWHLHLPICGIIFPLGLQRQSSITKGCSRNPG